MDLKVKGSMEEAMVTVMAKEIIRMDIMKRKRKKVGLRKYCLRKKDNIHLKY